MNKTLLLAVAMTFASSAFAASEMKLPENSNQLMVNGVVYPNLESINNQIAIDNAYSSAPAAIVYNPDMMSDAAKGQHPNGSNQLTMNGVPFPDVDRINKDIEFAKVLANAPARVLFNMEDAPAHAKNGYDNFLTLNGHIHPDLEAIKQNIEFERAFKNAPAAVVFDTEATQQNVKVNYAQ